MINIEIKICFEHWQSHTFAVIIVCLILFFGHQHRPFKFLLVEFLSKFPKDLFSWVSRRFVRKLLLHSIRLHPDYITLPCQIFPPDYITLQPNKIQFWITCYLQKDQTFQNDPFLQQIFQRFFSPQNLVDSVLAKSVLPFFVWIGFKSTYVTNYIIRYRYMIHVISFGYISIINNILSSFKSKEWHSHFNIGYDTVSGWV